jgi:hypothetical protein
MSGPDGDIPLSDGVRFQQPGSTTFLLMKRLKGLGRASTSSPAVGNCSGHEEEVTGKTFCSRQQAIEFLGNHLLLLVTVGGVVLGVILGEWLYLWLLPMSKYRPAHVKSDCCTSDS